ncbi:4Fe-4S dicluster domain-containing protein [Kallotenue papyrolyticum]|uniref:4Fe-4S dicluster domain-containing protein n=1 Tax=Kallotenue papyrolyticum TaxID=1325125 RepID=UPI000478570C|nr:4Fe-4S dicluster domain-containing protein [Kallotenue papyrolyticum]
MPAMGFYTDTSVCIGCKACQVACHQWNDLPAELAEQPAPDGSQPGKPRPLTGNSYDNTGSLSDVNWRHVKFIEKSRLPDGRVSYRPTDAGRDGLEWLMMSDVCKHCVNAPCLEVCPTGAIIRTEFDSVYIQEPVCNGCRACVAACPFGVIHMGGTANQGKGTAKKCTLCYDRLQHGLVPACAQACPTASIQFGPIDELRQRAEQRLQQLHAQGITNARLYGHDDTILGGLNAFYLLLDEPEVYGLPSNPKLPSRSVPSTSLWSLASAILMGLAGIVSFRKRRMDRFATETRADEEVAQ